MNDSTPTDTAAAFRAAAAERILVLDGAMGTEIQSLRLSEADFRGGLFRDHGHDLRGNNDLLILTQPDAIRDIHLTYFRAGADIVETNTFSSEPRIAQADYGMEEASVNDLNREGARLAREAAAISPSSEGRPAAASSRARSDRPTGRPLDFARRQQSGLSRRHLRRGARRLCRGRSAGSSRAVPTSS